MYNIYVLQCDSRLHARVRPSGSVRAEIRCPASKSTIACRHCVRARVNVRYTMFGRACQNIHASARARAHSTWLFKSTMAFFGTLDTYRTPPLPCTPMSWHREHYVDARARVRVWSCTRNPHISHTHTHRIDYHSDPGRLRPQVSVIIPVIEMYIVVLWPAPF